MRAGVGLSGTPSTCSPAAQRSAARMSESRPPHLPSTRSGSTRTPRPTLAMPMPLSVSAATRLDVRVPCQELLRCTSQSPKLPGSASFSAWVRKSPVSVGSASRPSPSPAAAGLLRKS